MKIKRFTLLTLPALVLIVGAIALTSSKDSQYFPRKSQFQGMSVENEYLKYIQSIKADKTTGEVDPKDVYAAIKQANRLPKSKAALNVNWSSIGPDNVGGRTRAIIVDKNNPDHIVAGSVTGGVYESFDGASSWEPYDPTFSVANISTITQAVDGSFYVGTGGHFESPRIKTKKGRFFLGSGIHKLTGNGNYQTIISPANRTSTSVDYATVGKLVASPTDPNKLYVAMNNGFRILKLDANGNVTSSNDPIGLSQPCNDIEVSESGKVVVTYKGKIYVSQSGDNNFVETTPAVLYGSYPGFEYGRIETAIAPTDDNIMYATVTSNWDINNIVNSNPPPVGNKCLVAVYRSQDSGQNWEIIRQGAPNVADMFRPIFGLVCTGQYSNTLEVYPDDAGKILVGGASLYRWEQSSTDPAPSNGSWNPIDVPNEFNTSGDPLSGYVHAGKHKIVWDSRNSDVAYIATNGGITKTKNFNDPTPAYRASNYLYRTTQYFSVAVNKNNVVMAGSQDNGTHILNLQQTAINSAYNILNDFPFPINQGIDTELSNINTEIGFGSSFRNLIRRVQGIGTTPGNSNFSTANIFNTNSWLSGLCNRPVGCTRVFYSPLAYWESFNHTGSTDSVDLLLESKDLPPLDSGTVINFEGNNNNYPQTATTDKVHQPVDTISGSANAMETFLLKNSTKIVANFDTIMVDTVNQTITINRRGVSTPVNLTYTYGKKQEYLNGLLGLSTTLTDSMITIKVDTFLRGENAGNVFMEVEKAFITFRYQLKFQDKVQTMLATANWAGKGGTSVVDTSQKTVFISRDLLKGTSDVKWFMVGSGTSTPDGLSGEILDMAFTKDGNHLFVATVDFIGGKLYRISDLNSVKNTFGESVTNNLDSIVLNVLSGKCHQIGYFPGQSVTAIDVDPNNPDNIVVALGNYNGSTHIQRTTVGTTAMGTSGTFEAIDGSGASALPAAPAYSVLIDKNDNNRVLVGSELGVFGTDNAFSSAAANVSWTEENAGMGRVAVFDIKQMRLDYTKASNDGKVYIATQGRGAFESDIFVGLDKNSKDEDESRSYKNSLKLYPNPVASFATLSIKITNPSEKMNVQVFNIRGQIVKNELITDLKNGENKVKLNMQDLNHGTYILRVIQDGKVASSKFIKN